MNIALGFLRTPFSATALCALAFLVLWILPAFPANDGAGSITSFPEIRDWQSVKITLTRGLCFGTCPAYSVEIHGDGTVIYQGNACVAANGEHRLHIPIVMVTKLVRAFRAVNYFSLRDHYRGRITDNPTFETSISYDGIRKSVSDYVGTADGMPSAVSELENAIDRTSHDDRWVYGNSRMCGGHPVNDSWRRDHSP